MRRALDFPKASVTHLTDTAADDAELVDLAGLQRAGVPLGLLALPAAVEDSFYRYNNLPPQLAALYRGIEPADPDEDLLEESEEPARELVDRAFLLDEVIDAIYQGLEGLPSQLFIRRPGEREGVAVSNGRPVLLALKRLFRSDWSVKSVLDRLHRSASIAVEARPVLVHERPQAVDVSLEATRILGREVVVSYDGNGAIVAVQDAGEGVPAGD